MLAVYDDCELSSLSFHQALSCADGLIGISDNCLCEFNQTCDLLTARTFLPPKDAFERVFLNRHCNDAFSEYVEYYLRLNTSFQSHVGYHFCPPNGNCHQPSFGKYVRYSSFLNYFQLHNSTTSHKMLYDIEFVGNEFRWTSEVAQCQLGEVSLGWGCIFKPMSEPSARRDVSFSSDFHSLGEKLISLRSTKRNHIVQLMIYGKLLALLTRPSNGLRDYIKQHVVSTHASNNQPVSASRRKLFDGGNSFKESLPNRRRGKPDRNPHNVRFSSRKNTNMARRQLHSASIDWCLRKTNKFALSGLSLGSNHRTNFATEMSEDASCAAPSVSMHVRQGDSCDVVLTAG